MGGKQTPAASLWEEKKEEKKKCYFSPFFLFFFLLSSLVASFPRTHSTSTSSLSSTPGLYQKKRKERKERKERRKEKKNHSKDFLDHSSFRPREGSFPPGSLRVRCHWLGVLHKGGHSHKLALSKWREEHWVHDDGATWLLLHLPCSSPTRPAKALHPPPQRTRRRRFKVFFLNDDGDRDWSQTCGIRPSFLFERSLQSLLFWKGWTSSPPPQGDWDPRTLMGPRPRLTSIFFKYGLFVFSSSKMDNKKK